MSKFQLGTVVVTPAALVLLEESGQAPSDFIGRHHNLEQGELDDEDQRANADAAKNGERILSSYKIIKGDKIWVITEHDRSVTTVLLPGDY